MLPTDRKKRLELNCAKLSQTHKLVVTGLSGYALLPVRPLNIGVKLVSNTKAKSRRWWAALRSDDLCCWLSDFIDEGHLVAEASHCHVATRRG